MQTLNTPNQGPQWKKRIAVVSGLLLTFVFTAFISSRVFFDLTHESSSPQIQGITTNPEDEDGKLSLFLPKTASNNADKDNPTPTPIEIEQPTPTPTLEPTATPTATPEATLTPTPTKQPEPTPTPTSAPTPTSSLQSNTTPDPNDLAVWEALAQCESGGNWSIDTGNGYYGGLQFSHTTWINAGGDPNILPSQASKEEQIRIGKNLQTQRGWSPWGACNPEKA